MPTKNLKKPKLSRFLLRFYNRGKWRKIKSQPGFTMIELLVVIVILGLLSTIGLGTFKSSQAKSRDARRKAELGQIARALEMWYNDHKEYPEEEDVPIAGGKFTDGNTDYMISFPTDPGSGAYYYEKVDDKSYVLYARLENILDRDAATVIEGTEEVPAGYTGADVFCPNPVLCNYAVGSTNVDISDLNKTAL